MVFINGFISIKKILNSFSSKGIKNLDIGLNYSY